MSPRIVQVSPSLPGGDVLSLRHRMMQCVLSRAQATEQAVTDKKVDQCSLAPPEEDVHRRVQPVLEADHHPHPPRDLPHPQAQDDVSRVLPFTRVAAQVVPAKKVDRHSLPSPEDDDDLSDALPPVVTVEHVEPVVSKHFPPLSYPKEVFPSTAAPLPFSTCQTLPPQTPLTSLSSQAGPVKQTPYPSPSTMDPPYLRNEPHRSSRCLHLCCAAQPPSSFPQEMPGDSVAVTTWVCLALMPWEMIKNSSVAVTTWVVSDIILSPLSEHPQLVAVPTQPVDDSLPH